MCANRLKLHTTQQGTQAMKQPLLNFRPSEDLRERIADYRKRSGGTLSAAVTRLIERGLLYGDVETIELAKSLSQLSTSYDSIHERLSLIEGEVGQLVDQLPAQDRTIGSLLALMTQGEQRVPTLMRALSELSLIGRLLASKEGAGTLPKIQGAIETQYNLLLKSIAHDIEVTAKNTATEPTK